MSTPVTTPPIAVPVVRASSSLADTGRGSTHDDDEARRRGRLVLAERVVEKIAGQAAAEVAAVSGRSGGFLGLGADADTHARPKVDVTLSADSADLAVSVGIAYPGSIRAAAQQVRDAVTRRVESLTGVDVRRVDVDVTFLTSQDGPTREALR